MAQLKSSVVQGSLRVTDTTYTTDLVVSGSKTARYALIAPTSAGAPTWRALTNADVGLGNVENTKLSTWAGTSKITTVGTVTSGTWSATAIAVNKGGTNITSYTVGDILYASAQATLSKLAGNTTVTRKFLRSVATTAGTAVAPAWDTVTKTDVGLGNVTNDAQVKASLGTAQGDMLYWSGASTPARLAKGGANTILTASGTNQNPAWTSTAATITSATSTTANTAAYANLTLGNSANVSTTTAHSEGQIILYSAATAAHTIKGASTTTAYTSTLPNNTGILVSLSGGTAKGSTTKPVYIPNTGVVTECDTYAGGTAVTLNNSSKAASTASFYAPTAGGTAGYTLIGAGTTTAPAWYAGLTLTGTAAASYVATFSGTTDATSSAGAVIINGGLLIKKKLYVTTATTLASTLGVSGAATFSSTLTANGNLISGTANYGAELPTNGLTTGRIFFQTSALEYELPAGGALGHMLVKNSAADRDVIWSDTVKRLTSQEGIIIATGGLLINSGGIEATSSVINALKVRNAVWNDYAECRNSSETQAGRVITETYTGQMERTTQRLMPACKVVSDTYGTLMGESDIAKTPIAVAGRVLVYPYQSRDQYNLGDAVCSAPNGTVDIMSREEVRDYPERIVGTVSEIPSYDVWRAGTKENPEYIDVNGRIWIYVR